MASEYKEKDATEEDYPGAEHRDFASGDGNSQTSHSPARSAPNDMDPVTHKMTTHGHLELVPQPSDDTRDPLVYDQIPPCSKR